jgi:uncharacterized protein YndB with AHSA1/START domain
MMKIKTLGAISGLALVAGLAFAGVVAAAEAGPSRLLEIANEMATGKVDTGNTVVLSADVACSPAESYRLWATADGAKSFFAPNARISDAPGGEYTVMFFPPDDPEGLVHGTKGARVLARDPGRFLAFEWVVFAGDDKKGNNAPPYAPETMRSPSPLPTWVELAFTPGGGGSGTHVEFRHFGFGDTPLWKQSQAWFTRAWTGVLARMKAHCEKQS